MKNLISLVILLLYPIQQWAQDFPSALPTMIIINDEGEEEEVVSYNGDAPLKARFLANPENVGSYIPLYEWTITKSPDEKPIIKRFDENIDYDFLQ